mmetsp:Transcript_1429/g.3099  ORF Transcript_1429/g.3099 Transcript_1429/m.3099 type:complete len:285 (+) Transcript_1429:86-940(+)
MTPSTNALSLSLPLLLLSLSLSPAAAFAPTSRLPSLRGAAAPLAAARCPLPLTASSSLVPSLRTGLATPPLLRGVRRLALTPLLAKAEEAADVQEEEEVEIVVRDTETGKSIECYVDENLIIDDKPYVLAYPCDRPVVIAKIEGEGEGEELIPVDDDSIGDIFEAAYKACAMCDAELIDSAVVLTLQGELEDDEEDEEEMLNSMGAAEEDEEFVKVLTSFYDADGTEFLVTEPLEPVIIIAKPTAGSKPAKGTKKDLFELLSNEELDLVMPSVEAVLEERYAEE